MSNYLITGLICSNLYNSLEMLELFYYILFRYFQLFNLIHFFYFPLVRFLFLISILIFFLLIFFLLILFLLFFFLLITLLFSFLLIIWTNSINFLISRLFPGYLLNILQLTIKLEFYQFCKNDLL